VCHGPKIWGIVQRRVSQSRVHNIDELKQHLLHVLHGIDQTIDDYAIDLWRVRIRACVRAKGGHFEQLTWQYSAIWRDISVFVKCDTIFRSFLCKLPQMRTSNFRKVVQQHTEGIVGLGSVIWVLLEIYFCFQQWKNFESPLRIDKVTAMSLVFFGGHSVVSARYSSTRQQYWHGQLAHD